MTSVRNTFRFHYTQIDVCIYFYRIPVPDLFFLPFFLTSRKLWWSHPPPFEVKDMAKKFSWAHLSDAYLPSASSETCTDLNDENLPSAFSETCTDLSDANLPSAFSETGWSISSLVTTMCSLSHMAEGNLDGARTTYFRDTLAKNDVLFKKKSHYHPGQIVHLRKRHSVKSSACRIILPPFPLRRRWSELALPTFMMASKNGNIVQQVNDKSSKSFCRSRSPSLYMSAYR